MSAGAGPEGAPGFGSAGFRNPFGGHGSQPSVQGGNPGGGAMDFFLGGGLLGKMKRDREAAQAQHAQQHAPQPANWPDQQRHAPQSISQQPMQSGQPMQPGQPGQPGQSGQPGQPGQPGQSGQAATSAASSQIAWCSPDFSEYTNGGTIYWSVDAIVTIAAPADDFDRQFDSMFLPLVGSLETHPDVENLALQVAMQEAGQIGQATQAQLAQNQAAFQAQQAAHRQQQAAFNSYNQSISDARNARHQQFMASSHAQQGHAAPDYSEAIRGVNTYTTSDGREVELSVHADRAYENQAGDVIGASGGFEPGAGWTEIPRT